MKGIIIGLVVLLAAGLGFGGYTYYQNIEKEPEPVVEVADVEVLMDKVVVQFDHSGRSKILMLDAVLLTQPDNVEHLEASLNRVKNRLVLGLSQEAGILFAEDNFGKSLQHYLSLFAESEGEFGINGALLTRLVVQ